MARKPTKKDLLLEAGLDIFYEKGFERATIDDIVSRANCGKGTFYRYFTGKEALFEALENRFRDYLLAELESSCPYAMPPAEFMQAAMQTTIRVFKQHQRLGLVKFARDQQTGDRAANCHPKHLPSIAYLHKYLQNQIEQGKIKPFKPEAITSTLFGAAHFYLFRDYKLGLPATTQELEETVEIILKGVLPQ